MLNMSKNVTHLMCWQITLHTGSLRCASIKIQQTADWMATLLPYALFRWIQRCISTALAWLLKMTWHAFSKSTTVLLLKHTFSVFMTTTSTQEYTKTQPSTKTRPPVHRSIISTKTQPPVHGTTTTCTRHGNQVT